MLSRLKMCSCNVTKKGSRSLVVVHSFYQQQSPLQLQFVRKSDKPMLCVQRSLSSFSSIFDTKYTSNDHRHDGIVMHPQSISDQIQPGNMIVRGSKKRYTEFVYGYFWMLKDLSKSNEKPIISNSELIPESKAKSLPRLSNIKSLTGQVAHLPEHIWRKNRAMEAQAQCTVVAISFRDFGYRLLSNWLDPFQEAFHKIQQEDIRKKDRVEVIRLNIAEGWLNKYILRGFIMGLTKVNTPKEEHERTFLYFGGNHELEIFRDALRMHNVLTGYVFLLDGIGRVRFAGCGPASNEEVERLVQMANDLISSPKYDWSSSSRFARGGTKRPKRTLR